MLEIKNRSVSLEECLGKGSFGTVYRATWESRKQKRDVAIKIVDWCTMKANKVYAEASLLLKCSHKHIVKCFGIVENISCNDCEGNGIVMEYMSSGDLRSYVENCEDFFRKRCNKWYLLKMSYQIGLAMAFLEYIGIVHRDLAARNVLVEERKDNQPYVKVADFGLARYQSYYNISYDSPIPFKWSAPEVLDHETYTHESDVWAFGVTIWEVYSFGSMPYGDMANVEVEHFINDGNRLEWPYNMPWILRKILNKCQQYDPDHRLTFGEIVQKLKKYFDRRPVDIRSFYYIS